MKAVVLLKLRSTVINTIFTSAVSKWRDYISKCQSYQMYLLTRWRGLRGLPGRRGMPSAAEHHRHAGRCSSTVGAEWILPEHCFPLQHTHTAHSTTAFLKRKIQRHTQVFIGKKKTVWNWATVASFTSPSRNSCWPIFKHVQSLMTWIRQHVLREAS